ncbi:N-acetyltransferase [Dictyobacter vulcani]|uniref:N-acetyltransferase n=1 Tax=Dictyobacter vulcani TaxID=2607529 RepID=A0A5J4KP44_9CHLR|nr:GNAT family N-acetyltransferase [Dictyobacter vulcani]GER88922.1 N-acetyltransferase [Dictyobacter vulcani]
MDTHIPPVTPRLATRLETSITFFSTEKHRLLSLFSNNLYGVHVRSFGTAIASLTQKANSATFNRVHHISADDTHFVHDITQWYRNYGARCSFEVVPHLSSPSLLWHLAKNDFYQSGFYNVLYGLPAIEKARFPHLAIRGVLPGEKEIFADIYFKSFGIPKTPDYDYVHDSICGLVTLSSNECFFALIDKKPVAIAVLSLHEQVGYLALAATLPSFRGYGCHKALLQTRIDRAAKQGCELIVGQAGVGTGSQHNMERVGLRLAYTKADWTTYSEQQELDLTSDLLNQ